METVTAKKKKKRKHVCVGGLGRWDFLYCQANIHFPDILTIKNIPLILIFFRKKKASHPFKFSHIHWVLRMLDSKHSGEGFFS